MNLVFVHGWGCDAGVWNSLKILLAEYQHQSLDLGFFDITQSNDFKSNSPFILIAHSYGLMAFFKYYYLQKSEFLEGIVVLNSFGCFAQKQDFSCGIPMRQLEIMKRRLVESPKDVLNTFWQKIQLAECDQSRLNQATPNIGKLLQGLQDLMQYDIRHDIAMLNIPMLAIAAKDDQLVSPQMTKDSLPSAIFEVYDSGGHSSGLNNIETTATQIKQFINTINTNAPLRNSNRL